jgi:hypothetical protein
MDRIALYLGASRTLGDADLRPYFQGAQATGLRIVTMVSEAPGRAGRRRRPVLQRLVARMEAGEFDAIVTVVDADVTLSSLPRPKIHGDTWIPRPVQSR